MSGQAEGQKKVIWIGSSRDVLRQFLQKVKREIGRALQAAQVGEQAANAKVLQGYRGAGVLEVVASHLGNAYRAVHTVTFAGIVSVRHAFEQQSRRGIETPVGEIETVNRNLNKAEQDYARRDRCARRSSARTLESR